MPFTTPLKVMRISPREWALIEPLGYQGAADHFTVPAGQITDFASVPNWAQSFLQATGTWTLAAVLHDDFCRHLASGDCPVSSRDADGIFRRVLAEEGVGLARRWAFWQGVRIGALLNRARRPGIARDLPLVAVITALELALVVGVALGIHALIDIALGS